MMKVIYRDRENQNIIEESMIKSYYENHPKKRIYDFVCGDSFENWINSEAFVIKYYVITIEDETFEVNAIRFPDEAAAMDEAKRMYEDAKDIENFCRCLGIQ